MISAYEVRANNGVTNIPALTGSNAGTVIIPGQGNCTLSGFTAGLLATEARVNRRFVCGALPGLSGYSPAQNTALTPAVSAALANPLYRFISPKKGVKDYGLKRRYYHLHLNVDYELGDTGVILSSLTGYNNEYYSELADLDNYDSRLLANPSNPGGTNPARYTYYDFPFLVERGTKDFSQEVRASYDKGPVKAILGASYLYTKSLNDLINVSNIVLAQAAPLPTSQSAPQKSKTIGIFGGFTYELGKISLSADARWQQDEIFAYASGNPLTIAANNPYGLPAGSYPRLSQITSKKFRKFLPRVIAQYNASNDLMVYGSWSKGANISLGSFNTNFLSSTPAAVAAAQQIGLGVLVQPETLDNYEIGVKGQAMGGAVRFSVSGYYGIWKNQMNNRSITFFDPAIQTSQVVSGVANSGKSILKGIEGEMTIMPVDGISIDLAGAINDSSIRTFADPSISKVTGVIGDGFRGNQLPGSSKYSGNVGLQYRTDIRGQDEASFFIRGDLSYKSRIFVDAANLTWIKDRTQVNFRLGVSKGPASIEAFLINAFNNKGYTSILNQAVITPNFALSSQNSYLLTGLPELRTFGLKAGYKF
jgi:iron complex outermembrane receptor protein